MNEPIILSSQIRDVVFGKDVKVVQPVNLYECKISDNCFVGPFVEIQSNVVIGNRTRVQSHTFICDGVTIGDDCFIGHGVMFINDVFTTGGPAGDKNAWNTTTLGNSVSIGSNATLLPVSVCDGAVIGAGAVVTKDIKEKGIYAGNPAKLIRRL